LILPKEAPIKALEREPVTLINQTNLKIIRNYVEFLINGLSLSVNQTNLFIHCC